MGNLDPNRPTPSPPPFLAEDPDLSWREWWRTHWHSLPMCCRTNPKDVCCRQHNPIAPWIVLPSPTGDWENRPPEWDQHGVKVGDDDEEEEEEEEEDEDYESGGKKTPPKKKRRLG
jgi:hypothetical protein